MSQFIDPYTETVSKWTDAPDAFHRGAALSIMGASLTGKTWLRPQACTTNLWVVLLGRSEIDHKSTAMDIATDILTTVQPDIVAPDPGSYEALVSLLSGHARTDGTSPGQRLLYYDEFQFLLDKFRAGSYSAPMLDLLNTLFSFRRHYVRQLMHKRFEINSAAVSILGGCTPHHIEKRQNEELWQGGLFSRLTFIRGDKTRELPLYRPNPQEFDELVERFATIAGLGSRELDFGNDGADQTYEAWAAMNMARQKTVDPLVMPMVGRLSLALLKMAAIREIDTKLGEAAHISEASLEWAMSIVEEIYSGVVTLPSEVAFTPEMQKKRRIEALIEVAGGTIGYSKLLRNSHLTAKELEIYLDTLAREGRIEREGTSVALLELT